MKAINLIVRGLTENPNLRDYLTSVWHDNKAFVKHKAARNAKKAMQLFFCAAHLIFAQRRNL